jgi:hypothetical protein
MATINGLQLAPIDSNFHLTELENNLIAQNINFQYIFCLKKSRWAATKKQMISVPVAVDTVINTLQQLPRLPSWPCPSESQEKKDLQQKPQKGIY